MSKPNGTWCLGLFSVLLTALVTTASWAQDWDPAPVGNPDEGDQTRVPIVFVHGQNGAGDQFERQAMHFTSNGYPASWVVPFDYNTARSGMPARPRGGGAARQSSPPTRRQRPEGPYTSGTTEDLDKFIDELRKRTGHDKVNLVGHSRGTFESSAYLSDPERAAKILHYASVGGGPATNPNGVASIAISGLGDFGRGPSSSDGGKVGWMPAYQDHVMVCTSDESFWEIYTFFNDGEKPRTMKIEPEDKPQVSGFVLSYIHNKPIAGANVEVWEVAPSTGQRVHDKPMVVLPVGDDGGYGPFTAQPGQTYEFVVRGTAAKVPVHVFRTPFSHSDRFLYFRIGADADDYTPSPFDKAPEIMTDKNAVFIVRHQNGSMVPGVMTLSIDGTDLIVDPIVPTTTTSRQSATVALYLADGNQDAKTDLTPIEGFAGAFVSSADIFVPADPQATVTFQLNDHVLNVPALPASTAGPISVVFENWD